MQKISKTKILILVFLMCMMSNAVVRAESESLADKDVMYRLTVMDSKIDQMLKILIDAKAEQEVKMKEYEEYMESYKKRVTDYNKMKDQHEAQMKKYKENEANYQKQISDLKKKK